MVGENKAVNSGTCIPDSSRFLGNNPISRAIQGFKTVNLTLTGYLPQESTFILNAKSCCD
jgi:hypothetical protein